MSAAAGGRQSRLLLSAWGNNLSSAALNQPWSESRCAAISNSTSERERLPPPHFSLRSENTALILSDTSKQTLAFQLESPPALKNAAARFLLDFSALTIYTCVFTDLSRWCGFNSHWIVCDICRQLKQNGFKFVPENNASNLPVLSRSTFIQIIHLWC